MNCQQSDDSSKPAAELMGELLKDPKHRARLELIAAQQQRNAEEYRQAAGTLLKELASAGFQVDSVGELRRRRIKYRAAISILLRWLPIVSSATLKEDIVRTLSVPWAKPEAAGILISEFRKAENPGLRWAIGNALEVVGDDGVFEEIVQLAQDKKYGQSREMLALALGKMKSRRAIPVLMELLDDEETVGHAVIALGKLRASEARERLEALTRHPKKWIQKEAKKALAGITPHTR